MACRAGAIVCGGGDVIAGGLSWVAGIFAKGKGAVDAAKKGIEFASDPFGFMVQETQNAVHAVAGVLIPWILSALHPDYSAQWWLKSYAVAFSMSMFVLAVQLLIIFSRRRRGSLGGKEAMQSVFIAAPAFMIGTAIGPVVGIALTKVFTAASDAVAQWSIGSTTEEFFTKMSDLAESGDSTALLGSGIVSLLVLGTLFLSLLGVVFILIIQLATQYLVGAVLPLGFVWIVNPDTRKLGKAVPVVWLVIGLTQVLMILLVGFAFRAINGIGITADPGTLGNLVNPIQHFINLAVPAVISFIVVFAPLSMLKFIPRPGGGGGTARTSGFTPPQVAPQIPNSPSRAPQSAHQTASSGGGGGGYQWNLPTAPASTEAAGGFGYGGSQVGAAGKAAGSGAMNVTANAGATAGKHAATTAAGTAGKAGIGAAGAGAGAAGAGGTAAAAAGTASTGVGAPLAVGMLLANSALKVAQQASQAASTAAEQAVEHGTHQEA